MTTPLRAFAEQMKTDAKAYADTGEKQIALIVTTYANSLLALAAGMESSNNLTLGDFQAADLKHAAKIEKQRIAQASINEEAAGQKMVEFADGPLKGDLVPCDARMPVGAKTQVGQCIYELRADRKLHLVAENK